MIRRLLGIFVLLCAALAYGGVWLWQWAQEAPAWYAPPAAANERVESVAEQFEYRVIDEIHAVRPLEEDWRLRLTEEEFNSWLAVRLPEWIAHDRNLEWPTELGVPQVHLKRDLIQVAIRVTWSEGSQVIVASVHPRLEDDRILAEVERLGVGRIAVDNESVGRFKDLVRGSARTDARWNEGVAIFFNLLDEGAAIDSRFELADGRFVRITRFELEDGVIELTGRTAFAQSVSR